MFSRLPLDFSGARADSQGITLHIHRVRGREDPGAFLEQIGSKIFRNTVINRYSSGAVAGPGWGNVSESLWLFGGIGCDPLFMGALIPISGVFFSCRAAGHELGFSWHPGQQGMGWIQSRYRSGTKGGQLLTVRSWFAGRQKAHKRHTDPGAGDGGGGDGYHHRSGGAAAGGLISPPGWAVLGKISTTF